MRPSEPRAGVSLAALAPPGLRWARLAPGSCLPPARPHAADGARTLGCQRPRHRPFRSPQAFDCQPRSTTSPPSASRRPRAETRETGEGKEEPGGRAHWAPGGRVSGLEAGAPRERGTGERARRARAPRVHLRPAPGPPASPRGARHSAQPGPRASGCPSPVPPLVLPPKPLTRVSLPTFLNVFCQLFAPGRNKALLSGCAHKRQFPEGVATFSPSPRTPWEGVHGHLPSEGPDRFWPKPVCSLKCLCYSYPQRLLGKPLGVELGGIQLTVRTRRRGRWGKTGARGLA